MNDPRGSLWRQWDLHVHTPASHIWKGGKRFAQMTAEERDQVCLDIVNAMNASPVAVFGIMDYWTFDGFLALRTFLQKRPDIKLNKSVFPGIELRCDAPTNFRLNVHVLLSDALTDQQLADFKNSLIVQFSDRSLSTEALRELPAKLAPDKIKAVRGSPDLPKDPDDLFLLGCDLARITVESLRAALAKVPEKAALLFIPFDTYGGLQGLAWKDHPLAASVFMSEGHIFEVRSSRLADCFRGIRTADNTAFLDNFLKTLGGRAKPVVSGSDAHAIADYGKYPVDASGVTRRGWIKADCTFEGLIQTIVEPAARTYVGERPPRLSEVELRPTKFIDRVSIKKIDGDPFPEEWFSADVPLNHELVAIIGNRGSGKSALADVLGLLGNAHTEREFSFLNEDKFRQPRTNKAKHFEGTLNWSGGAPSSRKLDMSGAGAESVKYLPQHYIERICNELGSGTTTAFDCEMKAVIFSHIPEADRLGKASIDELITARTEATRRSIELLNQRLTAVNARVVALEQRLTPEYRQGVQDQIRKKQQEVDAHEALKPAPVSAPVQDPAADPAMKETAVRIAELRQEAKALDDDIARARTEQRRLTTLVATAENVTSKLKTFQAEVAAFREALTPDLDALGIALEDLVSVEVRDAAVIAKRGTFQTLLDEVTSTLDASAPASLVSKRKNAGGELAQLQARLAGPARAYEAYVSALNDWTTRRDAVTGAPDAPGTLEYFRALLVRVDEAPRDLAEVKEERLDVVKKVFAELKNLSTTYKTLYRPLQKFAEEHPLIAKGLGLRVDVSMKEHGFADALFSRWNRGGAGSFAGVEEGARAMKSLLARHAFETEEQLIAFLLDLEDMMVRDHRQPDRPPTRVVNQLRKGQTVESLYDYVYSLAYIEPQFSLKLGDKEVSQLSPGERGALLLVFYLLIDKDDCPLIIDQPEENLDNQTVYRLLGECIKEAKRRRQIIVVTHNPNLAVACDAEQVIRAVHDPAASPRIQYRSGAIENPAINKDIIDVLEGTRPAFDNRDAKYLA